MYPGQIPQTPPPPPTLPFSPALPPVLCTIHPLLFSISPLSSISGSCPEIPTPSISYPSNLTPYFLDSEALRYPNQPLQNKGGFNSATF